jgi:hypothetical protein
MSIQADHAHDHEVERIKDRKADHHPYTDELRSYPPSYDQGTKEACDTSELLDSATANYGGTASSFEAYLMTKNHTESG